MKKFILSLVFISLISVHLFAFQKSDNLEIIKKKTALQLMRNDHHNSERVSISNPFRFNYEKKKEKTAVRSYSIEPGNRDPIDVKIDGEDQTTIVQGDDFVITIYFSDGCSEANVSMWADMNGNEIWEDTIDLLVPDTEDEIVDNDLYDEDPTAGVYQLTFYGDEEGPNGCSNAGLFFVAEDAGGIDDAYLWIDPITSNYSVSGSVTPAAPNVIIAAMSSEENMWMTATDASGNYQNFVPTVDEYMVMAFDPIGVLGGMLSTTMYEDVLINAHLTGYDFTFIQGNSTIEGTVLDENGAPVVGVIVYAEAGMPGGVCTETNSSGYYNLSVIEGWWEVEPSWDSLIPDYLCVEDVEVYVEDGGTETVDFLVYETDSTIEGTVYLDDVPTAGFEIDCWSELGMTETDSGINGNYILHVASEANATGGYCVNADIWDIPGLYVVENYNNIMSGSTGIDFHIYTVEGGVEGHVYDSVTQEPAEDCWINAFDGINWFDTGVDDDGYYQLPLPDGTYEVYAQGEMYYQQIVPDVVIEDDMITMDFYLDPISFDGELWGIVYETGTTNPIEGVQIWVFSDPYYTSAVTNQDGYYHVDLPNGTYMLVAWHANYYGVHIEDIVINYNIVQQDFEMEPVIFDGSLSGHVYEAGTTNPIINASISIWSETYWNGINSDGTGYYYFDLPNGMYSLDCWKEGYIGYHTDDIVINNDNVVFDIYMIPDVDADDELILPVSILSQNYPNPFNPETTISFNISRKDAKHAKIEIYNLKGQQVKTLECGNRVTAASTRLMHSITWDGTDENNQPVSSGIYFYKLKTDSKELTRKMLLLK